MMIEPVRLQLRRVRGFSLAELSRGTNGLPCIVVTRPGPWSNPFRVADLPEALRRHSTDAQQIVVERFEAHLALTRILPLEEASPHFQWIAANLHRLRGHNLACWCRPDTPCHGDALLRAVEP